MHRIITTVLRVQSISVLLLLVSIAAHAQSPAFTYQGRLLDSGASANGPYEMEFRLFDSMVDGTQQPQSAPVTIAMTVANGNQVNVTAGVFVVQLDFGRDAFPGADRYLQISVRHPGEDAFTVLSRQAIGATPYAIRSISSGTADNATDLKNQLSSAGTLNNPANPVDWTQLKNVPASGMGPTTLTAGPGLSISGQVISNTGVLAVGASGPLSSTGGQTPTINLSGVIPIKNGGTGSATQNFVDLSSNQTINGNKTFSGPIVAAGVTLKGNGRITPFDPALVATLRWDLLPLGYGDFPVGGGPKGVAFDGTNIWVANSKDDTVTKLRASDGKTLETFQVGDAPEQIAFDGVNLWVTNNGSASVTRINTQSKGLVATFQVGNSPGAIAFDGTQIWVSNSQGLTRLRASNGANLGTTGKTAHAFAFDGTLMWVTDEDGVKSYSLDGRVFGGYMSLSPDGLVFDGANIWAASRKENVVLRLRPDHQIAPVDNQKKKGSEGVTRFPAGRLPTALAYDGTYLWVTNSDGNVTKLRASDGANMGTLKVGQEMHSILFDGVNIWVTNPLDNTVSKR